MRSIGDAARGSREISQNISGVAQAAKSATDGTASSLRAAQDLARMAATLQKLVSQFSNLNKENGRS